jgi:hypothetical protein
MVLFVALGFFVVGLMSRAASVLAGEAERTSIERGAALNRGEKPSGAEPPGPAPATPVQRPGPARARAAPKSPWWRH